MNHASLSVSLGCQIERHFAGPVVLQGYRLAFNYPSVTPPFYCANLEIELGTTVEGALYQLPTRFLEALDRREGVALGRYGRCIVKVCSVSTGEIDALCYRSLVTRAHEGAPSEQYQAILIRGLDDARVSPNYRLSTLARLAQLKQIRGDHS
jgi:hypothetical protein